MRWPALFFVLSICCLGCSDMLIQKNGTTRHVAAFSAPTTGIFGQSNASGMDGDTTGWSAGPFVTYYVDPGTGVILNTPLAPIAGLHGCELTLANAIAAAQGRQINILKFGRTGTFISQWQDPGALWTEMLKFIALMQGFANPNIEIIWWQGESEGSDAGLDPATSQAYYFGALTQLFASVRAAFGGSFHVHVTIVALNSHWLGPGNLCAANGTQIRAAQEQFVSADSNASLVVLDSMLPASGFHYVNGQQLTVGTTFIGPALIALYTS